ncbi:hypothetical protein [Streptomyces sp. NPDC097640]|uniref:hypothetical protein n=1 Tax=Streptomyces sp. NPDC097640 TaxID=3157229 RepID=UPI003321C252
MSDRVYVPPRPPSRRGLWAAVTLAVVACLVLAGVWWLGDDGPERCAEGVWKRGPGQECVGVTDGSYVFSPELKKVSEKIRAENRRVEKSGDPWVAVAYTEPMTRSEGGPRANDRGPEVVRQAIEGAYLAQRELNDPDSGHGRTPQIKLLLANSGQGGEQWKPLVEQLTTMSGDERLVGVAGFGQSLETTKSAVDALREAEIPMVGATVAADRLSAEKPVFFRVSSPNRDQTAIAAKYLKGRQDADPRFRVEVVKDIKHDDSYNESLDQDFDRARRAHGLKLETAEGQSFVSGSSSTATALAAIADTVCRPERPVKAVYFAGRGRELKLFLQALTAPGRSCELTVVSGSSAVGVFFDPQAKGSLAVAGDVLTRWKHSGIKVLYTAYAHPDATARIYPRDGNPFRAFRDAYHDARFGGDQELQNGQAMMGHDAVLCLGKASRLAAGPQGEAAVDAAGVRNMLLQVGKRSELPGLSGRIAFDERGNPKRKPMALVELSPAESGHYVYRGTVSP